MLASTFYVQVLGYYGKWGPRRFRQPSQAMGPDLWPPPSKYIAFPGYIAAPDRLDLVACLPACLPTYLPACLQGCRRVWADSVQYTGVSPPMLESKEGPRYLAIYLL